jgi:hypothetical protein
VKDEGSNLNAITSTLKSIISYETLGLQESFNGIYFGHAFSKACQYATIDEKMCRNIRYVSIKATQANLQKCITSPKKIGTSRQEWTKAYIEIGIHP